MTHDDIGHVLRLYPRIYFACHTRHVRDEATGEELSAHQASILDHLDDAEPTNQGRLAEHMGVTASTMSLAVDRLEAAGYVRRERDPDDRRRVNVLLTDDGVRIKRAKSVLDPDRVEAMLSHLSPDDRRRAIAGLSLLARAADREVRRRAREGDDWRSRRSESPTPRSR